MESADLESMKLSDLFDLGWKLQRELSASPLSETDSEYIRKRIRATEILSRCGFMLDELHLFSENESLDEVSTGELRYFLNDALIGWLHNKVNTAKDNPQTRLSALLAAKSSYLKYLALTGDYELHSYNVKQMARAETADNNGKAVSAGVQSQATFDASMLSAAYERAEKIRRFKEQKELQKRIEAQASFLDAAKREHVDEEVRRAFYLATLKFWINQSLDEIKTIGDEASILESFALQESHNPATVSRMYSNIGASSQDATPAAKKPFIIAKDALQATVFGAGYPSLPVYSIEEFYDMNVANDCCAPPTLAPGKGGVQVGGGVTEAQKQGDKARQEALEDAHDERELTKQREWDEFKDENKRGAGNTYNRS